MSDSIPIIFVAPNHLKSEYTTDTLWFEACQFTGKAGSHCLLPGGEQGIKAVLVGTPEQFDTWTLGKLATTLPPRRYHLVETHLSEPLSPDEATKLCLGWQLGQYKFTKYQDKKVEPKPELMAPEKADSDYIQAAAAATTLVRDLINTPANDMGPEDLESCAQGLADRYGATLKVICGEALSAQNYPLIYAVGQASDRAPRLLDLQWGDPSAPKMTLVGKGVCFDSGGLNVKSSAGMKLMKKDMGGSAQVLGLALMVMQLKLPIRLRVLVGAVENSIAGNANRPLDILPSRKGKTVEIGNTDAEGRLVLADALWAACEDNPELIIDFATLTGAARVALGTELPAFFCNKDEMAIALQQCGQVTDDLLWQLPLHQPYRSMIDSKAADLSNIGSVPQGGAITAALFLQEFVKSEIPWIHIDLMAWNMRGRPGRPEGGEAMGIRAIFDLLCQRSKKG